MTEIRVNPTRGGFGVIRSAAARKTVNIPRTDPSPSTRSVDVFANRASSVNHGSAAPRPAQ